jgi:hypothetical protein
VFFKHSRTKQHVKDRSAMRIETWSTPATWQLRDAVCDFAGDSRHASPWAASIYDNARGRGKDHPHAVRILARTWLYVIWRCWQDGTAYAPAKHNALRHTLDQQSAATAADPGHDR